MRIRTLLFTGILSCSAALLTACENPVVAPAEPQHAAFARNPSGSPDKNNSCTSDGGARKSKNEKNQCSGGGGTVFEFYAMRFVYVWDPSVFHVLNWGGTWCATNYPDYPATIAACDAAMAVADVDGDKKVHLGQIEIHQGAAQSIPWAGFNSADVTNVALYKADGTFVRNMPGFYDPRQQKWLTLFDNTGPSHTDMAAIAVCVSDNWPTIPCSSPSDYYQITYVGPPNYGGTYNYVIMNAYW